MRTVYHQASKRGSADHGWLKANHSFSFANYYDRKKIHFGKLRVLNDDEIAPGKGFALHKHQNMEIITIPFLGAVRHIDNMGNEEIISSGDVQVMSAGSGIWHSEYNASETEILKLFQIWILSNKKGHKPRYDQRTFSNSEKVNSWQLLVSPKSNGNTLWIHQDAFISIIHSENLDNIHYRLKRQGNGVYFMLIEGEAEINNQLLKSKDALGCSEFNDSVKIGFQKKSKLLAIEVPMR